MASKPVRIRALLITFVLILVFILPACGDEEPEPPAVEQPAATLAEDLPAAEEPPAIEEPPATEVPPAAEEPPAAAANGIVDTGFRPEVDGFAYPNYGDTGYTPEGEPFSVINLTSVEMRRMFGDVVCAAAPREDGSCALTPPADQWMEQNNASMNGGHCEGFAVLSQMIYGGIVDPRQFGADRTIDLQLPDNEALQRELAYWFTTQGPIWEMQMILSPTDAVQYLSTEYSKSPRNLYRIGIRKEDFSGGHAITAYGVRDQGNGIYWIMVYDNNYPGQERYITVDTNANTWEYEASINPFVEPDLYKGNPDNPMIIAANEPRMEVFPCDFCSDAATGSKGGSYLAQAAPRYNQIWTEGYVNVELEDDQGRLIGYDKDGKFVNQISEAQVKSFLSATLSEVPPVIEMPVGLGFTAYIYGDSKAGDIPASLVMIGQGFYIGIDDLNLAPEQLDQLAFDGEGDFLTYTTDAEESPDIIVGIEKPQADFELVLKAASTSKGTDIHVLFDQKEDPFAFQTTSDAPAEFWISITRIGTDGEEETFDTGNATLTVDPDKMMLFYFGDWGGQGSNLIVGYDENGNGEIEESEMSSMADEN